MFDEQQAERVVTLSAVADGGDTFVSRDLDATPIRGRRVKVTVRGKASSEDAHGYLRLAVERPGGHSDAWDTTSSRRLPADADGPVTAILDVPTEASVLKITLLARGDGTTTFHTPQLLATSSPVLAGRVLTKDDVSRLEHLARLIGYLRFFHPSDQAAKLDWPTFEVEATSRMLAATNAADEKDVLRWLTAAAAPTASIYGEKEAPTATRVVHPDGWLTRWEHVGFGPDYPYVAIRDGLAEPTDLGLGLYKTASAAQYGHCKKAVVAAHAKVTAGSPTMTLYLSPERGWEQPGFKTAQISGDGQVDEQAPEGVTAISFGIKVGGRGTVDIADVTLACDGAQVAKLSAGDPVAPKSRGWHLFTLDRDVPCTAGRCIRVSRAFTTEASDQADVFDDVIAPGLRLRMPLAVWTDGTKTYPDAPVPTIETKWASQDLPARIASAMDIWITLRWFYPYFDDLGIRWDDQFEPAVEAAAQATTSSKLYDALARLVAQLHDDHAGVRSDDFHSGVSPLFFRRIGTDLYAMGGIGSYKDTVPTGTVLESIDGEPAAAVFDRASAEVSAATDGWRDHAAASLMGWGPRGEFTSYRVREPSGREHEVAVPRVDFEKIGALREQHPSSGTEIATGTIYIDLDSIDLATWDTIVPKLAKARAVIFDLRGYTTNAAFSILGHFTSEELNSPFWDSPIVSATGTKSYERGQWSIFPRLPHVGARAVFLVDGRTVSADETLLEIVRHYKLGLVVGEPTAGTNGNMVWFGSIGGWGVSFTGMHVLNQDGTLHQGRGITPDVIVHPTAQGVIAGKDEILDAALNTLDKN